MYSPNQHFQQQQQYEEDPFVNSSDLIYSKAHRTNIYICTKPNVTHKLPTQEELIVKIVKQGSKQNIHALNIQLTSDSELQFNFQFRCSDMEFRRIKEIQKFNISFREYPEAIIKNLQRLQPDINGKKSNYELNFTIYSQTEGKLDIIRKSDFRDDLIIEFNFGRSTEEHIQNSVQYRYNLMKREYAERVQQFERYRKTIKQKNPSLMMQIDKILKGTKK